MLTTGNENVFINSVNVFLPPPPWTGIWATDLFMPLVSTFLQVPQMTFLCVLCEEC